MILMLKNQLQRDIMIFVDSYVRSSDVPISRKIIISEMVSRGKKDFTIINSLNSLLKKGYLRRTIGTSNKTSYVQLKRV